MSEVRRRTAGTANDFALRSLRQEPIRVKCQLGLTSRVQLAQEATRRR
jgi:hypothetical protein